MSVRCSNVLTDFNEIKYEGSLAISWNVFILLTNKNLEIVGTEKNTKLLSSQNWFTILIKLC